MKYFDLLPKTIKWVDGETVHLFVEFPKDHDMITVYYAADKNGLQATFEDDRDMDIACKKMYSYLVRHEYVKDQSE